MADPKHLKILKQGVAVWNKWRDDNPDIHPELSKAYLIRTVLTEANLNGVNLSKGKLIEADLRGGDLSMANFSRANLTGANLSGTNLRGANLIGANLRGADLRGANLHEANLHMANLNVANLNVVNLNGADLNGANLTGANLGGTDLTGARLPDADLADADLTRANLSETKLHEANLSGANLADAVNLTQEQIGTIRFDPDIPPILFDALKLPDMKEAGVDASTEERGMKPIKDDAVLTNRNETSHRERVTIAYTINIVGSAHAILQGLPVGNNWGDEDHNLFIELRDKVSVFQRKLAEYTEPDRPLPNDLREQFEKEKPLLKRAWEEFVLKFAEGAGTHLGTSTASLTKNSALFTAGFIAGMLYREC